MLTLFATQAQANDRAVAFFGNRTRFIVMVLVLLCLTSIWSNILSFNIAVVCMQPENDTAEAAADTETHNFTSSESSWIVATVAIAAVIGNFPIVFLVNKVGIRTVFAALGAISAIATLLLPTAIRMGFWFLLVCRAFQGVSLAANFPVIGAFCAKWTYWKQTGLFVSVLVAFMQLSPALTNSLSAPLCAAFYWPSVFYAHGAISVLLFVIYALFYRNSPGKHPFVGDTEKGKIAVGKAAVDKKILKKVPYAAILRTPAVWAVWVAAVGNFTAVNMLFLFSPTYLSKALGFSVHGTGISAALPPLAQFGMKLLCGAISDRIKRISEVNKFRLFNSLAFFVSAFFFVLLSLLDDSDGRRNMIVLGCATGCLGAATGGFFKAGPVLSQQYSHFVTGNISLVITLTMVIVPFVVNALTPNSTHDEYKAVFLIVAAVQTVTNVFFVIFIRGEPPEWTHEQTSRTASVTGSQEGKTQDKADNNNKF